MAVTRASKEEELQALERAFKGTQSAVLVDFKGLKVPEVTELRRQVRAAKGEYKVVKNTLAKRALGARRSRRSTRCSPAARRSPTPARTRRAGQGSDRRSPRPRRP